MKKEFDITIIGGGMSGLITALALSHYKIPSLVIEKERFKSSARPVDGRTLAVSHKSYEILKKFNIWPFIEKDTNPIDDIYVLDNMSPHYLHFAGEAIAGKPMGYMIQNNAFLERLTKLAEKNEYITIIDNYKVEDVCAQKVNTVIKGSKGEIVSRLTLACDGKFSLAKKKYFTNLIDKSYQQNALIFNVRHEKPHENSAIEHFYPDGPFAILPLKGDYFSSIVWTLETELANTYIALPLEEFKHHVQKKFGEFLGEISITTNVQSYPLSATITNKYYHNRLALVADSAHVIHPLAGQGLNLGIRDIEVLVDIINYRLKLGLEINELSLQEYENKRASDNFSMFMITDAVNSVFSNHKSAISRLRKIGLSTLNRLKPIKTVMMRYAMGESS